MTKPYVNTEDNVILKQDLVISLLSFYEKKESFTD